MALAGWVGFLLLLTYKIVVAVTAQALIPNIVDGYLAPVHLPRVLHRAALVGVVDSSIAQLATYYHRFRHANHPVFAAIFAARSV
jgi:hypothetical protein